MDVVITDQYGNFVTSRPVSFTAPKSGAGGLFANGTTTAIVTSINGAAPAPVFTANHTAGTYQVVVATGGLSATFTLTNNPGPAFAIAAVPGTTLQSVAINTAFTDLAVVVTDQYGNPITDANSNPAGNRVSITFTAPTTGASGVFSNNKNTITVTVGAGGIASVPFKANGKAGSYKVTAKLILPVLRTFTVTFDLTNEQQVIGVG
jgi:hypothetical protein